ncbi:hypothetical protein D1J36_007930 [Riemerella anatipestifer]|uniref:hypothetical protein n=1 Tax=Riemerella anatipestifer TaxID=34085 RepID=UPI0012AD22E1|nr:hypothetical protein [Riemerella anatipestifer]USL95201.1 hypothetical protein D1J36_007930 [Riemerella anatipestifer]
MIHKWIKEYKDKRDLKKSNWGREYGWYIEYNGEIIGELVDCKWKDVFWDTYILKSVHEKWNQILTDSKSWEDFKYKNQHYNQYAINAFHGAGYECKIKLNERISMRSLYLTEIEPENITN